MKKYFIIPAVCPICGHATEIKMDNESKMLICPNSDCEGKLINKLDHFCGKKGLDIKGLSKATLEKLMDWGWVNNFSDIMTLANYRNQWISKPGFGEKSVDKILNAIEASKNTSLKNFIASLGIPLVGETVSKELVKHISTYEDFKHKVNSKFNFAIYDGFADSKTSAILNYDFTEADKVYEYLTIQDSVEQTDNNSLNGITVVITGKLHSFKNRTELQKTIESHGGKVVGSVSSNTNYLINNDLNSDSAKNRTAKDLGVTILSENEFINKFLD